MSKTVKWIVGIIVALLVLQLVLPFVWQWAFPNAYAGYGMMGRGYGYGMHVPMMGGYGYGMMPFGTIFMWLVPLATLALIGLGIAWLVKQLTSKAS